MQFKILIVEDEAEISEGIKIYLQNQGYAVLQAYNGQQGLDIVKSNDINLAIVDVMMPVMDGITMTMKIREAYDFPIIMLSAKSQDMDKITGLNFGADDYITKPFAPLELLARVNSQLRRHELLLRYQNQAASKESDVLQVGGLQLYAETKEVLLDGEALHLTPMEFKILELLMKAPGRVYAADDIYTLVWKEAAINTETVMVHIRKIREKIELDTKNPRYLKVVWGVGYKIEKQ